MTSRNHPGVAPATAPVARAARVLDDTNSYLFDGFPHNMPEYIQDCLPEDLSERSLDRVTEIYKRRFLEELPEHGVKGKFGTWRVESRSFPSDWDLALINASVAEFLHAEEAHFVALVGEFESAWAGQSLPMAAGPHKRVNSADVMLGRQPTEAEYAACVEMLLEDEGIPNLHEQLTANRFSLYTAFIGGFEPDITAALIARENRRR